MKKIKEISFHNISEFDILNYDFKKALVMYILLLDNIDNSFYKDFQEEMFGLLIDIKDRLFICLNNYKVLCKCLENQEEFNK